MKAKVIMSVTLPLVTMLAFFESLAAPLPGTQLWVYDAGTLITGSPALGGDGTVYVSSLSGLYAVTNSGGQASNKWVFPLPSSGNGYGSPAVGRSGTVYLSGGNLYAVAADGAQKWAYSLGGGNGSPAIGFDETLYVAGFPALHAVLASGDRKWVTASIGEDYRYGSPAVNREGTILVASPNVSSFFAIGPDGNGKWNQTVGVPTDSAAIGSDGTIYVTGDQVYAFSPSGAKLWSTTVPAFPGSPSLAKDGTIYVESYYWEISGYGLGLYAITPAGQIKWQFETNLHAGVRLILSTPAVDAMGTLYCTAYNSLYAVSSAGVPVWSFRSPDGSYSSTSPAIGPDGTIYATFGSRLYAFAGTNALADSPWPMYRQNPRHTGKVEKPSLQKPQKRSDANIQFELYAQVDQSYTIEASTNLNTWTSLTSFVATTVPAEVSDLDATNFPARFYRAVSASPAAMARSTR